MSREQVVVAVIDVPERQRCPPGRQPRRRPGEVRHLLRASARPDEPIVIGVERVVERARLRRLQGAGADRRHDERTDQRVRCGNGCRHGRPAGAACDIQLGRNELVRELNQAITGNRLREDREQL